MALKNSHYTARAASKRPVEQGFTLVEVLVALLLAGVVLAAVFTSFRSQHKAYLAQDQVAETQQNVRAAMKLMVEELQMAGFDPAGSAGATISTAETATVVFSYLADDDGEDNDGDGGPGGTADGLGCSDCVDEDNELKTVTYTLYDAYADGTQDLGRQVGASASTKRAVAENIQEMELLYYDTNGNLLAAPVGVPADIRSVQLTVLAVAADDDAGAGPESFVSPGGQSWTTPAGKRGRLLSKRVLCRNMGFSQ